METALLCKDRSKLQLWMEPGDALPPPSRGDVEAQAAALLRAADAQQEAVEAAAGTGSGGAAAGGRRAARTDPKHQRMLEEGERRASVPWAQTGAFRYGVCTHQNTHARLCFWCVAALATDIVHIPDAVAFAAHRSQCVAPACG